MPLTRKQIEIQFGKFHYTDSTKKRGAIVIPQQWIDENTAMIRTPLGVFRVHNKAAYQINDFLIEGHAAGLIHSCAGIFVGRHKMWDPARDLSDHSWGIAVDVNAGEGKDGPGGRMNIGANSFQPPKLVELGHKYGLECAAEWKSFKDGMHFAVVRLIPKPAAVNEEPQPQAKNPVLRLGAKGEPVKVLQRLLKKKINSFLVPDGVFGIKTEAEVRLFQSVNKLKADGVVGPITWKALRR